MTRPDPETLAEIGLFLLAAGVAAAAIHLDILNR